MHETTELDVKSSYGKKLKVASEVKGRDTAQVLIEIGFVSGAFEINKHNALLLAAHLSRICIEMDQRNAV